ncbi:MAG: RNase H-like domain-containing protein, partial [bacterium]
VTQLRSFLGLVGQLADFTPAIAASANPLRPLLRSGTPFIWNADHEASFKQVKKSLVSTPILSTFDPFAETMLQTDASKRNGLGFVLLQKQDGNWRLIQCGSRFVTETEGRYAIVELELRAVEWAVKKCRLYLIGIPIFTLVVDHQPLVTILDRYTLDAVENPRLQRMKERLSAYVFKTVWRKGSQHAIPDALSRSPIADPTADDIMDEEELTVHVRSVIRIRAARIYEEESSPRPSHLIDQQLEELRQAARVDKDYMELLKFIESGFPKTPEELPESVRHYWKLRADLWSDDGLVLFQSRIIVPSAKRADILVELHSSHQGIERKKRRARQTVYWPGITSDIVNTVRGCNSCQEALPSQQHETMRSDPLPTRVFEDTSADLFDYAGNTYLVYADRLSGWPRIDVWYRKGASTSDVIKALTTAFMDLGVPVRLRTDGGPQFSSAEFINFAKTWGLTLQPSTPYYSQSNGHAESAVKAVESLLMKTSPSGRIDNENFKRGMLEWRNTPKNHGLSPAQIVFGHPIRSLLPAHHSTFAPKWKEIMERREREGEKEWMMVKERYDKRAKDLKPLPVGMAVRIQDPKTKRWDRFGTIIAVGSHRDYQVKGESGRVYVRNRLFLRPRYDPVERADAPASPTESAVVPPEAQTEPVARPATDGPSHRKKTITFAELPPPHVPRRSTRQKKAPQKLDI